MEQESQVSVIFINPLNLFTLDTLGDQYTHQNCLQTVRQLGNQITVTHLKSLNKSLLYFHSQSSYLH